VLTEGNGPKPTTNDTVTVNYRGTLLDGTEFDSSFKRGQPATFKVTGVIPGWTEALQLMPVGSKWQLFIPSELAYRERGSGANIGPNAVLTFEVELLSIQPPSATATPTAAPQQPVTSDIIKVPSAEELKKGAKIEIIKPEQLEAEKEKERLRQLQQQQEKK
jgi:FKBP-type peptidyl-prolyl cis-trans isomerase FklB